MSMHQSFPAVVLLPVSSVHLSKIIICSWRVGVCFQDLFAHIKCVTVLCFLRGKYSTIPLQCLFKVLWFWLNCKPNHFLYPDLFVPVKILQVARVPPGSPEMATSKRGTVAPQNRLKADSHLW